MVFPPENQFELHLCPGLDVHQQVLAGVLPAQHRVGRAAGHTDLHPTPNITISCAENLKNLLFICRLSATKSNNCCLPVGCAESRQVRLAGVGGAVQGEAVQLQPHVAHAGARRGRVGTRDNIKLYR